MKSRSTVTAAELLGDCQAGADEAMVDLHLRSSKSELSQDTRAKLRSAHRRTVSRGSIMTDQRTGVWTQ